jgi:4-amino-4-deoxy-L-arabinose transferase-like glycosyltransferase
MSVPALPHEAVTDLPIAGRSTPARSAAFRRSFFWMVAIAFLLRFAAILLLHTYRFRTTEAHFEFGYEMGRVAQALASGHGFSNPFQIPTGPTAWEPPLYPYLAAAIFRVFGIYSHASAFVLLTINSFFSALTCIPIFLIAKRTFGEKVALWSAWLWAVLPFVMYWSTKWVWETSFSALLLATLFLIALKLQETLLEETKPAAANWRLWPIFGALWGIAALDNPALLSFLPVSLLWVLYRRKTIGRRSLLQTMPQVLATLAVFGAITGPWLLRNYNTFGKFIFIRDNLGAELRLGNGPDANGTWMWYLHPTQNVLEMRKFQRLGEIAYIAQRRQEAVNFILHNPGRFVVLSLKRFVYYWSGLPRSSEIPALAPLKNSLFLASSVLAFFGLGLALRRRVPAASLFFLLLLFYPAVYYVVFPHPRYRHPIEPEMLILGVYLITQAETTNSQRVKAKSD